MNTPTDDAQEGDMAEAERPPQAPIGYAEVGPPRAATQAEEPGEIRHHRGAGRRVNLRRESSGAYSLWLRNRMIQSFCGEWEDVTRFQLPEGIQQQVRIVVQPMGEAREWNQEETRDRDEERVEAEHPDDGVELRLSAHPNNPPMVREDLLSMFNALPAHNQEIIAGQIRANYEEATRPIGIGHEFARAEVTMEMFNDLQRHMASLTALVHRRLD